MVSSLLFFWAMCYRVSSVAQLFLTLQPHGLQHARLPCQSSTPVACSDSCPSSRWCCPIISSSVIPFSSGLQSFPASGSFPVSQIFASGGQSFSITPSSEYSGRISFRIDSFDLLAVQGTVESSPAPQFRSICYSAHSILYGPTLTSVQDYWKDHSCDWIDLCQQSNVSAC